MTAPRVVFMPGARAVAACGGAAGYSPCSVPVRVPFMTLMKRVTCMAAPVATSRAITPFY